MATRYKMCVTYYRPGKRSKKLCKSLTEKQIKRLMGLPKSASINSFRALHRSDMP
jgi:site-specific recombinase XerD